uniref:Uncharacterized protein n=1 Tax=Amphimedon queenslandica TaxID=400682 RepID=A0A1X7URW9_AMPQE
MLTIVQFKVQVMLECIGEAPSSATVTVHCNDTGSIELSSSYVIEYTKQPNNITGSVLVPLNQQYIFPPSPNISVTTINTTIYATTTTTTTQLHVPSTTTTVSTTLNVSTVITATSLGVVIVLLLLLTISLILLVVTYKRKLYRFASSQQEISTSHNEAYQSHTSMITTTNPVYEEIRGKN